MFSIAELTNTRWTRAYLPTRLYFPGNVSLCGSKSPLGDFRAFAEDNTWFNLKLPLLKLQSGTPIFQVSCASKAGLGRPIVTRGTMKGQN